MKNQWIVFLTIVVLFLAGWVALLIDDHARRPRIYAQQVDDYPLTDTGWTPHRWAYLNPATFCPICGLPANPNSFTSARKPCDCCGSDLGWVDIAWTYSSCGHELLMRLPCRALKPS